MSNKIERLQNYGMYLITSSPRLTHSADLRKKLKWVTLEERRQIIRLTQVHQCFHGSAPQYWCNKLNRNSSLNYINTRGRRVNLQLKRPQMEFYRNSFEYTGAFHWNDLPAEMKAIASRNVFKHRCKSLLFMLIFVWLLLTINFCLYIVSSSKFLPCYILLLVFLLLCTTRSPRNTGFVAEGTILFEKYILPTYLPTYLPYLRTYFTSAG